jgi:DNA polymerase-3 subunit beta
MNEGSFQIPVTALRAMLGDVAGVVEARNTIPILSNVLVSVGRTSVVVTGTDMDVWAERHHSLTADEAFSFTVEAGLMARVAAKLPADGEALVKVADGKLTLSVGRSRFSMSTLPVDDFPSLPRGEFEAEFEMPAIYLAAAFDQVAHCISTEETRYYLNGVFVHAPSDGDLRFATTDGHRLARCAVALPDGAEALPDVIIPRKVVKLLLPLLGRYEGNVDVRISRKRVRFEIGSTTIDAKTIDGEFPDYTRVIPSIHTAVLSITRDSLAQAVARVATISTEKTRAVKFELDSDLLVLSVSSSETGTAREEVPCAWPMHQPLTIGFNAKYLGEMLGHMSADTIEATFTDSAAPSLWRDSEAASTTFVLMPLRV